MLDEVEQHRLGPVDVLQDDEERTRTGERLEQAPHRPEEFLRPCGAATAEHAEALDDEGGVGLGSHRVRHGRLAAEIADELRQRPERDPVSVGEAAAGHDRRVCTDLGDQLGHEPRLADAGRADHRHQPAVHAVRARGQLVAEHSELGLPPDEGRVRAAGKRLGAGDRLEHVPRLDRRRLPFRLDRADRLEPRGVPHELFGHRADQDLASQGALFKALRGVHGVSSDECRGLIARYDLPGVDADPDAQLGHFASGEAAVETLDGRLHLERRADRPQRVVLVRPREAEDGHHGIADELLHRASVRLDGVAHRLVPGAHQFAQRFGIEPLPERGRTGQVAEEDTDRLPRCCCRHHLEV